MLLVKVLHLLLFISKPIATKTFDFEIFMFIVAVIHKLLFILRILVAGDTDCIFFSHNLKKKKTIKIKSDD